MVKIEPQFYPFKILPDKDVIIEGTIDEAFASMARLSSAEDFKPGMIRMDTSIMVLGNGGDDEENQSSMVVMTCQPDSLRTADGFDINFSFQILFFHFILESRHDVL